MARITGLAIILVSLFSLNLAATEAPPTLESGYRELANSIDQILRRTGTPGAAVAVFEPDGTVWRHTTGLKNIERNEKVDRHAVFRVGSVSKMLVGLAVMKLVSSGQLSLQDRVAELAQEVAFENPWEERFPIRLVHLLNHTTGWDAPHPPELVSQGKEPLSSLEALAMHPHSRRSRWIPGSRTAYNNSGPLVAAYIVEKITGMRFEDYIATQFLAPLHMEDSGYFYDDHYRSNAATLYRGKQALPYWRLPNRAAGGLHSSLEDMIKLVRFMQSPDQVETQGILSSASVRAMEQPSGSLAAAAGVEIGWGIGLTSFHHKGLILYGHEGALPGARALVAYNPQSKQGHVVLTNGESPAASQIHKLLAEHEATTQTVDNAKTSIKNATPAPSLAGFYRLVSPSSERWRIANKLIPWKLAVVDNAVVLAPLIGGNPRRLSASSNGKYLQEDTGRIAMVEGDDPLLGRVIQYGPMTLKKNGAIASLAPVLLLGAWIVAAILGLLFLLIWLPRKLFGRHLSIADRRLRAWSVLPIFGIFVTVAGALLIARSSEPFAAAATITLPSMMVFVGPIVFLLAAIYALRVGYLNRKEATAGFWRHHAMVLMLLNAGFGIFLLSCGMVGLRLWT